MDKEAERARCDGALRWGALAASLGILAANVSFAQGSGVSASAQPRDGVIGQAQIQASSPSLLEPELVEAEPTDQAGAHGGGNGPSTTFTLREVVYRGGTALDPATLDVVWADYAGKDVTLKELSLIAALTQKKYRDEGYLASRVILPAQTIKNGVVEMKIYEGVLDRVVLPEGWGKRGEAIADRIRQLQAQAGPLRRSDVERAILLARDIPGVDLSVRLEPAESKKPGGIDMHIEIVDNRVEVFGSFQNTGSKESGQELATIGARANGVFTQTDRMTVVGVAEPSRGETLTGYAEYDVRPFTNGLVARVGGAYGFSRPGGSLTPLQLDGENFFVFGEIKYPVVRSPSLNLFAALGVEYSEQWLDSGSTRIVEDEIFALYGRLETGFRVDYGISDKYLRAGEANGEFEYRRGVDGLGSEAGATNLSRNAGLSVFDLVRGAVSYRQPVTQFFEVYLRATGQMSLDPLLAFEETSLGGFTVGRGYDPAALSGDTGYGATAEIRVFPPFLSNSLIQRTEFFAFVDGGAVYNRDPGSDGGEDLLSYGGGARLTATELEHVGADVKITVTYARPVEPALSTSTDAPSDRITANVSVEW